MDPQHARSFRRDLMGLVNRMLCQKAKRDEFIRIHRVMDSIPARTLKRDSGNERRGD